VSFFHMGKLRPTEGKHLAMISQSAGMEEEGSIVSGQS
jgi:hypothetical protein